MACYNFGVTLGGGGKDQQRFVLRKSQYPNCFGFLNNVNMYSGNHWPQSKSGVLEGLMNTSLIHVDITAPVDEQLFGAMEEFVHSDFFERLSGGVVSFGRSKYHTDFLGTEFLGGAAQPGSARIVLLGDVESARTVTALRLLDRIAWYSSDISYLEKEELKYYPLVSTLLTAYDAYYSDTLVTNVPLTVRETLEYVDAFGVPYGGVAEIGKDKHPFIEDGVVTLEAMIEMWTRKESDFKELSQGWGPVILEGYVKDYAFVEGLESPSYRQKANDLNPNKIISVSAPLSRTQNYPGKILARTPTNQACKLLHAALSAQN